MLSGQLNRVAGLLELTARLSEGGLCAAVREEEGGRVVAFDGFTVRSPPGATLIEELILSVAAGGEVRAAARAEPFPGAIRTDRGAGKALSWPALARLRTTSS